MKREPVVVERTYRASVKEVWDLWTTKKGFESWWGPEGFRAEVQEIDARVGGALRYQMIAETPEMIAAMEKMGMQPSHPNRTRFTEFEPRERLVLKVVVDFVPGVATYDTTIAVQLVALGDRTRMVVTLGPMHSEEFSNMQKEGFTSQLTKLDRRFGSSTP
jgi:uncharacterized protein YndB with AHSA1/START domain